MGLSGAERRKKEKEIWEVFKPCMELGSSTPDRYMAGRRLIEKKVKDPMFVIGFNEQKIKFKEFFFHNFTYEELVHTLNLDMRECVRKKET